MCNSSFSHQNNYWTKQKSTQEKKKIYTKSCTSKGWVGAKSQYVSHSRSCVVCDCSYEYSMHITLHVENKQNQHHCLSSVLDLSKYADEIHENMDYGIIDDDDDSILTFLTFDNSVAIFAQQITCRSKGYCQYVRWWLHTRNAYVIIGWHWRAFFCLDP